MQLSKRDKENKNKKKAINKKQQQKKYLSEKLMGICSIVITMNSLFLTLALTDFLVLIDLFDHLVVMMKTFGKTVSSFQ